MADTTPYDYPAASAADQERFALQQAAASSQAKVIRSQDRSVERHSLKEHREWIEWLRSERRRTEVATPRMFHVQVEH